MYYFFLKMVEFIQTKRITVNLDQMIASKTHHLFTAPNWLDFA